MNTRAISARILNDIRSHKFSLIHLEERLTKYNLSKTDQAFVQALCYGGCRFYYELLAYAKQNLYKKPKPLVMSLIIIGLYQLKYMNQPNYAVINETVAACKSLKIIWEKGLVNSLLRNFKPEFDLDDFAAKHAYPNWLFEKIKSHYPDNYQSILTASNKQAPMFLRINAQKISTEDYLRKLSEKKISAFAMTEHSEAIQLENPIAALKLPKFAEGYCSVQDISAQFAADILAPKPYEHILDACAAPGGKTIHLLEKEPSINITAIDNNPQRLTKISENINRIFPNTSNIHLLCADSSNPDSWNSMDKYDAILLDAPCSAIGVIRRHPDIKLLRTEEELKRIIKIQAGLLKSLWSILKIGGRLLYATCSILPDENDGQIESFLNLNSNAKLKIIPFLEPFKVKYGYQLLNTPEYHGDGFYYCLLEKNNN